MVNYKELENKIKDLNKETNNWYINLVIIFITWGAGLTFSIFLRELFTDHLEISRKFYLLIGILLILFAIYIGKNEKLKKQIFYKQLMLMFLISGELLVNSGMYELGARGIGNRLVLIIINIWIYLSLENKIAYLLAPILIEVLTYNMIWYKLGDNSYLLFLAINTGMFYSIVKNEKIIKEKFNVVRVDTLVPIIGIANLLSLYLPVQLVHRAFEMGSKMRFYKLREISLIFFIIGIIGILDHLTFDTKDRKIKYLSVWTLLFLLVFPFPRVTGILFIIILSLSYKRKIMTIASFLALLVEISIYYYNLEVTLLRKSLIMIIAGIAILIVRLIYKRRGE